MTHISLDITPLVSKMYDYDISPAGRLTVQYSGNIGTNLQRWKMERVKSAELR